MFVFVTRWKGCCVFCGKSIFSAYSKVFFSRISIRAWGVSQRKGGSHFLSNHVIILSFPPSLVSNTSHRQKKSVKFAQLFRNKSKSYSYLPSPPLLLSSFTSLFRLRKGKSFLFLNRRRWCLKGSALSIVHKVRLLSDSFRVFFFVLRKWSLSFFLFFPSSREKLSIWICSPISRRWRCRLDWCNKWPQWTSRTPRSAQLSFWTISFSWTIKTETIYENKINKGLQSSELCLIILSLLVKSFWRVGIHFF